MLGEGFFTDGNGSFAIAFALVLALSVAAAQVSRVSLETPGINLGKRIIKGL